MGANSFSLAQEALFRGPATGHRWKRAGEWELGQLTSLLRCLTVIKKEFGACRGRRPGPSGADTLSWYLLWEGLC